mgnify:CR=1 FL=1
MWAPVLDKYCDKFELFALKNSFKISPEVRMLATKREQKEKQNTEDPVELYNQQHEELDQQIAEAQKQLYQERCKNQVLSAHLNQLNQQIPPSTNLSEISAYLDEHPLPIEDLSSSMESVSTKYTKLEEILTEYRNEISQLPPLDEDVDLDSKFLAHSQATNVQSISALQSLTDAMEED